MFVLRRYRITILGVDGPASVAATRPRRGLCSGAPSGVFELPWVLPWDRLGLTSVARGRLREYSASTLRRYGEPALADGELERH